MGITVSKHSKSSSVIETDPCKLCVSVHNTNPADHITASTMTSINELINQQSSCTLSLKTLDNEDEDIQIYTTEDHDTESKVWNRNDQTIHACNDVDPHIPRFCSKLAHLSKKGKCCNDLLLLSAYTERLTPIMNTNFNPHTATEEWENVNINKTNMKETNVINNAKIDNMDINDTNVDNTNVGNMHVNTNVDNTQVNDKDVHNLNVGLFNLVNSSLIQNETFCKMEDHDQNQRQLHILSEIKTKGRHPEVVNVEIVIENEVDAQLDKTVDVEMINNIENDKNQSEMKAITELDNNMQRVHSVESESIYILNGISNDSYQRFREKVNNYIRPYGFLETFPSPSIIEESQNIFRSLEILENEDNFVFPHPPRLKTKELLSHSNKSFDKLWERIISMSIDFDENGQTAAIVHYLCNDLDDDLRKVMAILAWVVFQQVNETQGDYEEAKKPDQWCALFQLMCKYTHIKTKLITGIVRRGLYIPGDNFDNHRGVWIAVLINNTWTLVDPVLPSTECSMEEIFKSKNVFETCNNLCQVLETMLHDPEQMIFSNFPDEECWQLLARPVEKEEFTDLACVSNAFFRFGMKLLNPLKSIVHINQSETKISLAFLEDTSLEFKCKIFPSNGGMTKKCTRSYVFMETNLNAHLVNLQVRFARTGDYILHLYGSTDSHKWQKLITYRLIYEGSKVSEPFPNNPREEWGPGLAALKLGLTPMTHHSGQIIIAKGVSQIVFHDSQKQQFNYVLLNHDVKTEIDCLKVSIFKDKHEVTFIVDIETKSAGLFILKLLARSNSLAEFQNFCNYLIRKEKSVLIPALEFSNINSNYGKQVIYAPENGQMNIYVDVTDMNQLSVELKWFDREKLNLSNHARYWIENSQAVIDLNFPRKGKYNLKVLGRSVHTNCLITLKDETIEVSIPSQKWSPFPKEGEDWNSVYKLECPLNHHLEEKDYVIFKIDVKNAHDVAVLMANGWYHLEQTHIKSVWTAKVLTGPKSTKCTLLARFEVGSSKWSELLWFKILSKEDFDGMKTRHDSAIKAI